MWGNQRASLWRRGHTIPLQELENRPIVRSPHYIEMVYRIEIKRLDLRQFVVGIVGRQPLIPWIAVISAPGGAIPARFGAEMVALC